MRAIRLRTEYLENPMGIDITGPRFFWNCEGDGKQGAWQIVATDDRGEAVWDSGKVAGDKMAQVPYRGRSLRSREHVIWKVKLWNERDEEGEWSEQAFFEMGLLDKKDWKASWITGAYKASKKERYPVDYFRKTFEVENLGEVKKVRMYVTACGDYVGTLNGGRVGDFVLAPGHTDYKVRVQYQTYDVTGQLKEGKNELVFALADGWYRGSVGAWGLTCEYGVETKLLAQLEITKEDGSVVTIVTDGDFEWSNGGPIRFADHKDGEIVDARKSAFETQGDASGNASAAPGEDAPEAVEAAGNMAGVTDIRKSTAGDSGAGNMTGATDIRKSTAGDSDAGFSKARVTAYDVTPTASNNVAVKEQERFAVARTITTPRGKTVLDFGQNIAGYVEFRVTARAGQKIVLRFGEMLDKDGEFTQKNIQCSNKKKTTPLQQVEYICKEGENRYKTTFAIFGFQLVQVETDVAYGAADFTAIAVYSDMGRRAFFDSSNGLLNRLVESTLWSARNNSADVPTDCPTRERHGWAGDAQIFFMTAGYLLDYAAFARKYERDMCDWQKKDRAGRFPQIAPAGGVDSYMETMNGSVGWADAGVMIPYRFWKLYGDRQILTDNYEAMRKYAKFMMKRCGRKGFMAKNLGLTGEAKKYAVNTGQSYGEWAEPADVHANHWTDMIAPHPEVSTAYTSHVMGLMKEIARELGRDEDAKEYAFYEKKVRTAYQALVGASGRVREGENDATAHDKAGRTAVSRASKFSLDTDRQARLVRPLYFGLLNKEQERFAKKRLIQALENYGWRLGTGFLSTPLILDVLEKIDVEAAYRLLENEEMPGWLFMPKSGANTIWESWEGTCAQGGIASLDHYSKGAVCEWLFRRMCGIEVAGENRFTIAPLPGGHFTHAKTEYQSVYGVVKSGWKLADDAETENAKKTGLETESEPAGEKGLESESAGEKESKPEPVGKVRKYVYEIEIPANTTADIVLPDGRKETVGVGTWRF